MFADHVMVCPGGSPAIIPLPWWLPSLLLIWSPSLEMDKGGMRASVSRSCSSRYLFPEGDVGSSESL